MASDTWVEMANNMLQRRIHFCAVAIGSVGPAGEQDLFESLIAEASRGHP
jgi:hypothetical protein